MKISKTSILTSINFIENIRQKMMADTTTTSYKMEEFRTCVLGAHHFDGDFWVGQTFKAVAEILGLDDSVVESLFIENWISPFEGTKTNLYNEYEWMAIRLFTSAIGFVVTKEDWLRESNETIIKLAIIHDEMDITEEMSCVLP